MAVFEKHLSIKLLSLLIFWAELSSFQCDYVAASCYVRSVTLKGFYTILTNLPKKRLKIDISLMSQCLMGLSFIFNAWLRCL